MIFLAGCFIAYFIAGVGTVFLIGLLNGDDYIRDEYDGDVITTSITIAIWPICMALIALYALKRKISS